MFFYYKFIGPELNKSINLYVYLRSGGPNSDYLRKYEDITAFLMTGLEPGTFYIISISAISDKGEGSLSSPLYVTTLPW